jgi:hypothetical protein
MINKAKTWLGDSFFELRKLNILHHIKLLQ